jgi:acyl carrier protein
MERKQIAELIIQCLEEVLSEMDESDNPGNPDPAGLSESTPLLGRKSMLDSLALVTLIVSTEQTLKERQGISVTIVDERALSMEKSPFRTVGTLADYVWTLVKETLAHAE